MTPGAQAIPARLSYRSPHRAAASFLPRVDSCAPVSIRARRSGFRCLQPIATGRAVMLWQVALNVVTFQGAGRRAVEV